jgi:hypothetical protein
VSVPYRGRNIIERQTGVISGEIQRLGSLYKNTLCKLEIKGLELRGETVVQWSQLLTIYPEVSGSIPGATRFSE